VGAAGDGSRFSIGGSFLSLVLSSEDSSPALTGDRPRKGA